MHFRHRTSRMSGAAVSETKGDLQNRMHGDRIWVFVKEQLRWSIRSIFIAIHAASVCDPLLDTVANMPPARIVAAE